MPATQLLQITAPHFRGTMGFDVVSGRVIWAPLEWMVGRNFLDVLDYCVKKGWRYEAVPVVKGGVRGCFLKTSSPP